MYHTGSLLYGIITVTLLFSHVFFTKCITYMYKYELYLCIYAVKFDGHQYSSYCNQYIS